MSCNTIEDHHATHTTWIAEYINARWKQSYRWHETSPYNPTSIKTESLAFLVQKFASWRSSRARENTMKVCARTRQLKRLISTYKTCKSWLFFAQFPQKHGKKVTPKKPVRTSLPRWQEYSLALLSLLSSTLNNLTETGRLSLLINLPIVIAAVQCVCAKLEDFFFLFFAIIY